LATCPTLRLDLCAQTATKIGLLGDQEDLRQRKVDYMKNIIIQESHAKSTLENLKHQKNSHTIFSLDVESFYPSVTHNLVQITINCFGKTLQMKDKLMIRECLKLIHFGMGNTLITFEDKCFEHDGDRKVNKKGLTISGYESA
jgi:hypothetical protein